MNDGMSLLENELQAIVLPNRAVDRPQDPSLARLNSPAETNVPIEIHRYPT